MDSSSSLKRLVEQTQERVTKQLFKEFTDLHKLLEDERNDMLAKIQQERERMLKEFESERNSHQNKSTVTKPNGPVQQAPIALQKPIEVQIPNHIRGEVIILIEGEICHVKGKGTTFDKSGKELTFILEYLRTGVWKSDQAVAALGPLAHEIEQVGVVVSFKPVVSKTAEKDHEPLSIKDKIKRFQQGVISERSSPIPSKPSPIRSSNNLITKPQQQTAQHNKQEEKHIPPKLQDKTPPPSAHAVHLDQPTGHVSVATGFVEKKVPDAKSQQEPQQQKLRVVFGAVSEQGERPYNEDRFSAYEQLPGDTNSSFFGVYDGHGGINGSVLCKGRLHKNIVSHPHYKSDRKKAITEGFIQTDRDYREKFEDGEDGSTAVIALLTEEGTLFVANAGDSRCIMCQDGNAIPLSRDHKANDKPELTRIEKAGHTVEVDIEYVDGEKFETYRVDGELAVSRAIGDLSFKDYHGGPEDQAVTCVPDIVEKKVTRGNFLVLACDGLWDVMDNQEVVDFILDKKNGGMPLTQIADELVQEALNMGSQDNVTVIIVDIL